MEERKLDEERDTDDLPAQSLYQFSCCHDRSPCCQKVVMKQNFLSRLNRVFVDFNDIGTILKGIFLLNFLSRKLPALPDRYKARS